MSTKRSINKIVERAGMRYVQGVIENTNCIFQEILQGNDQGNDCFIEFISNNVATSFCIFGQIKSGKSYRDKKGYKIYADKKHIEYWHKHLLPVAGIVYDEEINKAFWINISLYIKSKPQMLNKKTHTIRLSPQHEFTFEKFNLFKNHFVEYINEYKSFENFGRSLDQFAKVEDSHLCYEGLKSLFSNHRDKETAWYYIISNFGNINESSIHRNILGMISNYADNPHVFWHKDNIQYLPTQPMQNCLIGFVNKFFKESEVRIALSFMNKMVLRGDFGYLVLLVLGFIENVDEILYSIAYDNEIIEEDRNFAFWLYIHFSQRISADKTVFQIDEYLKFYKNNEDSYIFNGMRETIAKHEFVPIG